MRYLVFLLLFLGGFNASAQIVKTAGIPYTATTPAHTPSASGSLWAIDTANLDLYAWYGGGWNLAGERIQSITGCVAPAYTPGKGQALFVINACDSLYYYRGGAWRWINTDTSGYNSTLTYSGDTLYLTDGGGTLSVYVPTGGAAQVVDTFEIVSNTLRLSLSDDDVPFETVDLSPYLDNTDDQKVDTFSLTGNTLSLSVESDGEPAKTVDLSAYLDNTDAQTLSIDSSIVGSSERFALSISNGNTVNFDVPQSTPPGGSDTHIQFNDGGSAFGGDSDFTWNKTTNTATVNGGFVIADTSTTRSYITLKSFPFLHMGDDTTALINSNLNLFLGYNAGNFTNRGYANTGIGFDALKSLTTGNTNTVIGNAAGDVLTTGYANTLIGRSAGGSLTTGFNNAAVGSSVLGCTTCNTNVTIGADVLTTSGTGGNNNVGIGNTIFTSGSFTGSENVAIGRQAMANVTSGTSNTAIGGRYTGLGLTTGSDNTFVGHFVGDDVTTGSNNTMIGSRAGNASSTAGLTGTVFLGYAAGQAATQSNSLYIHNSADSLPLIGGNFSTKRLGVSTDIDNLARTLHVTGEVRITDLVTDNPTVIVGADSDGDLNRIILGDNLSLSNDTLNATAGAGVTDLSFSGASSPVTLVSSSGDDVTITAGSGVTLSATASNLTITATGGSSIDSTTARNTGATGEGVYSHEDANVLNFKKLIAGSGVTLTPADSSITIAATGGSSPTVITPANITADQDDYSPTDWATATIVRISGDSMIRAITGFASVGIADGHEKKLVNVGSYPVYIPGEHPDSQDSNRVSVSGDYFIYPKATAVLVYDNTANRWIIASEVGNRPKTVNYEFSPGSGTAGDWGNFIVPAAISSGTVGTNAGTDNVFPASWTLSTSATANSGASLGYPKTSNQNSTYGDCHHFIETYVSLSALSTGSDTFYVAIRMLNATATALPTATAGVSIVYSHIYNSGNWSLISTGAGSSSPVDLGVAAAVDVPVLLRLEVDKNLSEARAYVNGSYAGRVATNLPATTTPNGGQVYIRKAATGAGGATLRVHSLKGSYIFD